VEKRENATFVCRCQFWLKKKSYGTIQNVETEVVVIDWRSVDECPYLF